MTRGAAQPILGPKATLVLLEAAAALRAAALAAEARVDAKETEAGAGIPGDDPLNHFARDRWDDLWDLYDGIELGSVEIDRVAAPLRRRRTFRQGDDGQAVTWAELALMYDPQTIHEFKYLAVGEGVSVAAGIPFWRMT